MSQSLAKVYLHIVFSTKNRKQFIFTEIEKRFYCYISSICNNIGCHVHEIGGMEDHIHIILELSRTVTISKLLETIKANSSRWIKSHFTECKDFSWQGGFGAFSVDQTTLGVIKKYVSEQKHHHKKRDFKQELILLLKRANIQFDERYLWD